MQFAGPLSIISLIAFLALVILGAGNKMFYDKDTAGEDRPKIGYVFVGLVMALAAFVFLNYKEKGVIAPGTDNALRWASWGLFLAMLVLAAMFFMKVLKKTLVLNLFVATVVGALYLYFYRSHEDTL